MYSVTSFSPDHISSLRVADLTVLSPINSYDRIFDFYAQHPSFTLWHDGNFIASGGVMIPWKSVGEGWMLMGKAPLESHGKALFKYTKLMLKVVEDHFRVKRIQCVVLAGMPTWMRFAMALGFETEGLMRKYGPDGNDYFMMSRIKWDQ